MGRDVPLAVLLSWPKANLVDPETRGWASLIINVILLSIVIPVVAIRLYTRHFMRHWLGWDDFFCALALFFNIAFTVCVLVDNYVFYCNRHVWDIPINVFERLFQVAMACKVLFTITGTAIRQSLLCFYLRLLGDAGITWFRWVIYAATTLNILAGLIFGFLSIFQCNPVSAYWKFPSSAYGTCLDEGALTFASGVIITTCDFLVVLLPIPIIMKLQMSRQAKMGVICLLNLGMAASAVAVVRTYYVWKALVSSYDTTWWAYPLYIAASVEINVAIICACAPACRPFVAKYMPWLIDALRWIAKIRYLNISFRVGWQPSTKKTYPYYYPSDRSQHSENPTSRLRKNDLTEFTTATYDDEGKSELGEMGMKKIQEDDTKADAIQTLHERPYFSRAESSEPTLVMRSFSDSIEERKINGIHSENDRISPARDRMASAERPASGRKRTSSSAKRRTSEHRSRSIGEKKQRVSYQRESVEGASRRKSSRHTPGEDWVGDTTVLSQATLGDDAYMSDIPLANLRRSSQEATRVLDVEGPSGPQSRYSTVKPQSRHCESPKLHQQNRTPIEESAVRPNRPLIGITGPYEIEHSRNTSDHRHEDVRTGTSLGEISKPLPSLPQPIDQLRNQVRVPVSRYMIEKSDRAASNMSPPKMQGQASSSQAVNEGRLAQWKLRSQAKAAPKKTESAKSITEQSTRGHRETFLFDQTVNDGADTSETGSLA